MLHRRLQVAQLDRLGVGSSGVVAVKTYRGIRDPECHVVVLDGPGEGSASPVVVRRYDLNVPPDLLTRPPRPFEWGTGTETPGTHYLAVAILADLLGPGDRNGIRALLPFLRRFLARLPKDGFEISDTVFFALFSAIAGTARAAAATHVTDATRHL